MFTQRKTNVSLFLKRNQRLRHMKATLYRLIQKYIISVWSEFDVVDASITCAMILYPISMQMMPSTRSQSFLTDT